MSSDSSNHSIHYLFSGRAGCYSYPPFVFLPPKYIAYNIDLISRKINDSTMENSIMVVMGK